MGDWAEEKAWEWDGSAEGGFNPDVQSRVQSLAALLREVDKQGALNATPLDGWVPLAEVRVIVMNASAAGPQSWLDVRDEILARLEALK